MSQKTPRNRRETPATASDQHSNRTSLTRDSPITPTGVVGLTIVTAGFGWFVGPLGLVASVPIVLTWLVAPAPFAVAVAVVTLSSLPSVHTTPILFVFSIGAVAMLFGDVPITVRTRPVEIVVVTVVATLAFAAIGYGTYIALGAWITPLVLAALFSLVSYTLYRYTIVRNRQFETS